MEVRRRVAVSDDQRGGLNGVALILIIDDDVELASTLAETLRSERHDVRIAHDGRDGFASATTAPLPDLIILDLLLPDLPGTQVCRSLRESEVTRETPVIICTVKDEEADRIAGFEAGADDYIVKPFSPSELVARLRAVIRRAQPAVGEETLRYADVAMDLAAHRVSRAGRAVHLGPTEFRLLHHFLLYPGRVFSREHLLDRVWGPHAEVEMRTVDVHIRRLRKALNIDGCRDLVRTVRSVDYALDHAD